MTDATVVEVYYDDAHPDVEEAELTVTDGETYQSRKFNSIRTVQLTGGEDVDAHLNAVVSGGQVTINYAGQTDKKVYITIKGTP